MGALQPGADPIPSVAYEEVRGKGVEYTELKIFLGGLLYYNSITNDIESSKIA